MRGLRLWTPTNGAVMAILLASGVPYGKWIRFVLPPVAGLTLLGVAGVLMLLAW